MKKSIIILICVILSSCVEISSGYTISQPLNKYTPISSQKYDVTYSVSYFANRLDIIGANSETDFRVKIAEKLKKTGLFSKVTYTSFENKSDYHYHFKIIFNAPSVNEEMPVIYLSGVTMLLIPAWETASLDFSGIVYFKNKEIYSSSTPEIIKCYWWLPLIPIGIIWNDWFAMQHVENKEMNYVINKLSDFHQRAFINK